MDICLTVPCERNSFGKEKIYYLLGAKSLLFNGCKNMCGAKDCDECGKKHYNEAMKEFIKITEPYVSIND